MASLRDSETQRATTTKKKSLPSYRAEEKEEGESLVSGKTQKEKYSFMIFPHPFFQVFCFSGPFT
jgi:hypothetical protein